MGKKKNKSEFGMLSVKAGIDNNPNPSQADRIVGAQGAANIGKLLQSQPGSMGLLNPNQSIGKVQSMVRQQPTTPMGMDVSCLLYTSPSPRDRQKSRMPSSA